MRGSETLASFSRKGLHRNLSIVIVAALGMGVVGVAFADKQPSVAELTVARELFGQGVKLEEAHDWSGALERFRAVSAVKKTPAVHFHLGLCLENTGLLVEALDNFQRASEGAGSDKTPDAVLIAEKSRKHVDELTLRIPRLIVRADPPLSDLHVSIDGAEVELAVANKGIPLDPGTHVVGASAPGHVSYETKIELLEKAPPREIAIALAVDPNADKTKSAALANTTTTSTLKPSGGRGPFPWVFGAVSIASFATAGAMYGLRSSAISDLEGACSAGHSDCPPSKRSIYDHGKTYTTVGNVMLGVGAVTLATSVLLFVLIPSETSTSDKTSTSASVSIATFTGAPLGASLVGCF